MAKRRSNGEGSLYFDEAKGLFRAMIITPAGGRLTKSSKKEEVVKDWLNEQRLLIGRGQHIDPHGITLGRWIDEWLETYAKHSVRPRTYDRYISLMGHTEPIQGILLSKLLPAHIQRLYNGLEALAGTTKRHIHYCLSGCLKQAVRNKLIYTNPLDSVDAPKAKQKQVEILSDQELAALIKAAEKSKYPAIIHIAISTGMRISEILALKWEDIDFKKKTIMITRTLHSSLSQGTHFCEPKTDNSRRKIKIDDATVVKIKEHKLRHGQNELLFVTKNGQPFNPASYLRYHFPKIRDEAGIDKGFHSFRHTHATHLIAAGVPIQEVSRRLGHSRISTTLDIYTHAVEADEDNVINTIDSILTRIQNNK